MGSLTPDAAISDAIALIGSLPGYQPVAARLSRRRIRYRPDLPDRGQVGLLGGIVIGPEPIGEGRVSLAGTLVHEEYHTRQNPFLKTYSFWAGVFTRTHPMRRYEQPAYQAHTGFLEALAAARPDLADTARQESRAVRFSFRAVYGAGL